MTPSGLISLHGAALNALATSADPSLEDIRWQVAKSQIRDREASPAAISRMCGKDEEWGAYAFKELRLTGFIENSVDAFTWRAFDPAHLATYLDLMSAFESAAILRTQFVDVSHVRPKLRYRHRKLKRIAQNGDRLETIFELQKLLVTLVASAGSPEFLAEYISAGKTAVCYAWADALPREDLAYLTACADRMMALLSKGHGREAARICCTLRLLPFVNEARALCA